MHHVANKCDLSAFTSSGGRESWHADLRGELERKKKQGQKKPMTYTGYHTAQKRRARRGDRLLERAVVATKLGESRTETNAEKWRKGKKKQKNKQTKQGHFPSTVGRPPGMSKEK
jgi:hypothetical protein